MASASSSAPVHASPGAPVTQSRPASPREAAGSPAPLPLRRPSYPQDGGAPGSAPGIGPRASQPLPGAPRGPNGAPRSLGRTPGSQPGAGPRRCGLGTPHRPGPSRLAPPGSDRALGSRAGCRRGGWGRGSRAGHRLPPLAAFQPTPCRIPCRQDRFTCPPRGVIIEGGRSRGAVLYFGCRSLMAKGWNVDSPTYCVALGKFPNFSEIHFSHV